MDPHNEQLKEAYIEKVYVGRTSSGEFKPI
jgi:hypothetical protein